jgi:hypothetical protein
MMSECKANKVNHKCIWESRAERERKRAEKAEVELEELRRDKEKLIDQLEHNGISLPWVE